MRRWVKRLIIFSVILASVLVFLQLQNNWIKLQRYNLTFGNLPDNFRGYKIVQISDLHSKEFGNNQKSIVDKIKKEAPDVIFATGDFVDRTNYDEGPALDLLKGCRGIAPVYFIPGNHEYWSEKYEGFRKKVEALGVTLLEDKVVAIELKGQTMNITGLIDPVGRVPLISYHSKGGSTEEAIKEIAPPSGEAFSILLSHRPEFFDIYCDNNFDLVFSGHAHGGQFRLPIVGGIVAPDQGFFPKYDKGIFREGNTTMVVSSGLGNSVIPQRIFNRPEIVVITLEK
jgi:predicted MPP superfamily phosphohydrolase